jgi:hypothetical protein
MSKGDKCLRATNGYLATNAYRVIKAYKAGVKGQYNPHCMGVIFLYTYQDA